MRERWARLRPEVFERVEDMPRGLLAREIGVSTQALRGYVTGRTQPNHWKVLHRIAEVTGVPAAEVIAYRDGGPNLPCPAWCQRHALITWARAGWLDVLDDQHTATVGLFEVTGYRDGRVLVNLKSDDLRQVLERLFPWGIRDVPDDLTPEQLVDAYIATARQAS